MLGTVQFGMDYGISNDIGRPSYETVCKILKCAIDTGINCLDTARLYGESEKVISRAMSDLGIADRMVLGTKVAHIPDECSDMEADQQIRDSVTDSLKALNMESLPLCLLHLEKDFRYIDALLRLKADGLVRHVGVSVMTPAAAMEIVASGLVEAIQSPVSMLDRRFLDAGVLAAAKKMGVAVFARSTYLQGLLLMDDNETPPYFSEILPVRRRLRSLASEVGTSLAELAVRYVLSLEGVVSIVMGVVSVEQVRQGAEFVDKGPLAPELVQTVEQIVPVLSEDVVRPDKWTYLQAKSELTAAH